MNKNLKKSRDLSKKKLAEINKQYIIEKMTQYYTDFMTMYGIFDVSPVSIAQKVFERHKKLGLLDEVNMPVKNQKH